jgi:CRP-like cAMP-binding protein
MIDRDELRKVLILGYLKDSMLEKLLPHIERVRFDTRDYVFKQGDVATTFFMLMKGKVLLEQRISDKMSVSIESIRPGYSLGWSAMLPSGVEPYSYYTSDAICAEPSDLFAIKGEDFNALVEEDFEMGFIIYRRLLGVINRRLHHRTTQFVRIIKQHPDIENLIFEQ